MYIGVKTEKCRALDNWHFFFEQLSGKPSIYLSFFFSVIAILLTTSPFVHRILGMFLRMQFTNAILLFISDVVEIYGFKKNLRNPALH